MGSIICPLGTKAGERKDEQKVNNAIVDLVAYHFPKLATTAIEKVKILLGLG